MGIANITNNILTDSGVATSTLVPTTRTLTINGVAFDLSADRSWTIATSGGTVTSVAALTLGTTGTDLSSTVATGTTTPVITLNVPTASAANRGALSAADWTTFNNKASTAALANYLPLAGGTMTGAIVGTTATFTNSGSGVALGVTQSGSAGDGILIGHSAGRALNLNSSGTGFGILINNDTAATSAPFTIQKSGLSVITLTDAGAGSFSSSLTASSFIRSGGTAAQFLKANGSIDSNTYLTTTSAAATYAPLTGTGTSGTWGINITGSAGSAGSVTWANVSGKPSNIMYYQSFTLDANTMDSNATGFTYSNNAPFTGPIARISAGGSYDLWIGGNYGGGGNAFYLRTRNGDAGTFNPWRQIITDGNIGSQTVSSASTVTHFASRTDSASYNVVWAAGNPSHMYSCDAVRIQSSTGTLFATTFSGALSGNATTATNSTQLNGYAFTSYAYRLSGTGYYQINDWVQVNTNTGLYWPNHYSLHFYPNNDGSYGSAQILGEKNGWRGLHFGGGTGITLMMNEAEFGFHRQAVGWVARFTSGTGYFDISGSAGSVAWTNVSGRPTALSQFTNDSGFITSGNNVVGLYNSGFGNSSFTWYQSPGGLQQYTGSWASFLISNHGDGATYYNQTIIMPFWGVPQYMRKEGTVNVGPWTFWTTENLNPNSISGNFSASGSITSGGLMRVNASTNLYLDYNYGCSIVGVYSSFRYQGVFSMGDAYKLAIDGSSPGNLYGLSWSHPNAGGQAGYLNDHGLLVMVNGVTYSAMSSNIWARGRVTANEDVYSTSGWFYSNNNAGWYNNTYGQGIRPAKANLTFGNVVTVGENFNGYGGYGITNTYNTLYMQSSGGDHGFYRDGGGGGWSFFYHQNYNCAGIGTDATDPAYSLHIIKYGGSNTGWIIWSDRRIKENIKTIDNALDKVLSLRGVYYNKIDDPNKERCVGYIAQEVMEVVPELVVYSEELDMYNMNYGPMVGMLTEAIKEQQSQIETLKEQVQTLLNHINNGV